MREIMNDIAKAVSKDNAMLITKRMMNDGATYLSIKYAVATDMYDKRDDLKDLSIDELNTHCDDIYEYIEGLFI